MTTVRYCAFLLLVLPLQIWALESDSEQPIEVEADSLEVRESENISVYQGNVRLVQGSLEITSDELIIRFSDSRDLERMEMSGAPARFRQLDDEHQEMIGQAERIIYNESESMLELQQDARFSHAGDSIEGNLIRINTDNNSIQAGSSKSDQRVKMLIQPRQNSAE